MTVTSAIESANRNKRVYGGEWQVWEHERILWIRMATDTSRLLAEDATLLYCTEEDETHDNNNS